MPKAIKSGLRETVIKVQSKSTVAHRHAKLYLPDCTYVVFIFSLFCIKYGIKFGEGSKENIILDPKNQMNTQKLDCKFYSEDLHSNRKKLFQDALKNAKNGKVLYIMCDELEELPELSQELTTMNRHYMKMISFLYAKSLGSLIESLTTLPEWQSVPSTIILDDLTAYCNQDGLQNACGVVALLIDSVRSCSQSLGESALYVSATREAVDEHYCNTIRELYFT